QPRPPLSNGNPISCSASGAAIHPRIRPSAGTEARALPASVYARTSRLAARIGRRTHILKPREPSSDFDLPVSRKQNAAEMKQVQQNEEYVPRHDVQHGRRLVVKIDRET